MRHPGIALLAVLLVGAPAGTVRADRLDAELNRQMPAIVATLRDRGFKNVGVLPVRVQQGSKKESFAPPLGGALERRLENLLVVHVGPEGKPLLGVIRAPGRTAARSKVQGWYGAAAGRRKLFGLRYPRAWGDDTVRADAFVTGKLSLGKDRQTTLALEYFDRADPTRLRPLGKPITIDTDRFILRDLGRSFAVSKRSLALKRSPDVKSEDRFTVAEVADDEDDRPQDNGGPGPGNVAGVLVEMLVNRKPQTIRKAGAQADNVAWQTDSPSAGAALAFRLKNTTDRRLGVVLRLNGVNTINEETLEPENCRKWVLPPGRAAVVNGFYLLGGDDSKSEKPSRIPFKVLVGREARQMKAQLGPRAGLIDVDVFEEGPAREAELFISARGLPPSRGKRARSSYLELKRALLGSAGLMTRVVGSKELIVPDTRRLEVQNEELKEIPFPNPRLLAHLTIKVVPADLPKGED
jgi:hypothetical protein